MNIKVFVKIVNNLNEPKYIPNVIDKNEWMSFSNLIFSFEIVKLN